MASNTGAWDPIDFQLPARTMRNASHPYLWASSFIHWSDLLNIQIQPFICVRQPSFLTYRAAYYISTTKHEVSYAIVTGTWAPWWTQPGVRNEVDLLWFMFAVYHSWKSVYDPWGACTPGTTRPLWFSQTVMRDVKWAWDTNDRDIHAFASAMATEKPAWYVHNLKFLAVEIRA